MVSTKLAARTDRPGTWRSVLLVHRGQSRHHAADADLLLSDRALSASTLGAPPFRVFQRIVFPLTLPGVALGSLLCFVLAVSSFITPKLLGGGRVFLLATEIYDQAIVTLNWPLAATLSILILVIFGGALVLYTRALRAIM